MAQEVLVGLIVVAAALYSVWMFMPAPARRASAARLAALARRCGLREQDSERLRATLSTRSSCGQCDSCRGCAIGPRTAAGNARHPASHPDMGRPVGE